MDKTLERLEKSVKDTGDTAAAASAADHAADHAAYHAACHAGAALVAWVKARDELGEYLKEQQGNAVNAAYDTLRKSVLGRDYKLERDK